MIRGADLKEVFAAERLGANRTGPAAGNHTHSTAEPKVARLRAGAGWRQMDNESGLGLSASLVEARERAANPLGATRARDGRQATTGLDVLNLLGGSNV